MKEWTIEEFLKECEKLCWNMYDYNYANMPEGTCNGHYVAPYEKAWHSIIIDESVCSMAFYSEEYPNGNAAYIVDGKEMTALEYVRYKLEK